ncbi:hypothetical protein CPY51_06920 [Rhizobium tubonense]|uniref:HTH cro/C1-type domain-containing protein n=1 Tax=Rhizobium tubonense TaxID=484088 RepID=A0A2W4F0J5_9HYPH|nr:hypothetical protein CPY51_06920 [Rhizobium tubonense]
MANRQALAFFDCIDIVTKARYRRGDLGDTEANVGTDQRNSIDIFVGSRIKARRLELGIDQKTLADSLGITALQVENHESGNERISVTQLQKVEKVLRVSPDFFFAQDSTSPFSMYGIGKPDCLRVPMSSRPLEDEEALER